MVIQSWENQRWLACPDPTQERGALVSNFRTVSDHFHQLTSACRYECRLLRSPSGSRLASVSSVLLTPEGQFFFLINKVASLLCPL